jgi:amino acid transporter
VVISLVAAALIWFLAYGDVRVVTRALLSMEGLTVALIVVLVVVIFARIFGGTAPGDQEFTLSAFALPGGIEFGTLGLATVFGILSFAGFEGAASLGEETDNPRRNIPHAIAGAVITMGIFYVIVMLTQTLGFGVNEAGTESFAGASSPLGELSTDYIGPGMAAAINFGVMISAFASALGTAPAGSRMLFALCRDGFLSRRLGETSPRTGAPAHALAAVKVVGITTFVTRRSELRAPSPRPRAPHRRQPRRAGGYGGRGGEGAHLTPLPASAQPPTRSASGTLRAWRTSVSPVRLSRVFGVMGRYTGGTLTGERRPR